MKNMLTGLGIALALSLLLWMLRSRDESPAAFIPADILALLVINRLPDSVESLQTTRLREWVDFESQELQREVYEKFKPGTRQLLESHLRSAWLVISSLSRKGTGHYRIHFTVFLVPKWGVGSELRSWILQQGQEHFGEGAEIIAAPEYTVLRGSEEGQVLLLGEIQGILVVSNGLQTWQRISAIRKGELPRLADTRSFRRVTSEILLESDLVLYVRGGDRLGLIPEFGYSLNFQGDEALDSYFELRPETPEPQPGLWN